MSSFSIGDALGAAADTAFSAALPQQAQNESVASAVLVNGTKLYNKGNYEQAIKEFKRAIGLAPHSTSSVDTYNFIANSYLKLNRPDDAISAYKSSINLNPSRDDTRMKLGNVYMSLKRYDEAESEYKSAIKLNPSSISNVYTLGQLYLQSGRYNEAESQFNRIINIAPRAVEGYYGLGLTYSKEGRHEDAINQFKEAITMDSNFNYAYVDLGSAYADSGQMDEAQKQVDILKLKDASMAAVLSTYISDVSAPKIFLANPNTDTNFFLSYLSSGTLLSSLNISLATPNATQNFNIDFYFDKPMDMDSVQNTDNWQISRASAAAPDGGYNWGLPIPQTEVTVFPIPQSVIYDRDNNKATLTFTITQNAAGDGTIDPSHLVFKFNGKDVKGMTMDETSDEYSGAAGVV